MREPFICSARAWLHMAVIQSEQLVHLQASENPALLQEAA